MPTISTNTAANTALRYLNANSMDQSDSLAKIASGSSIIRASDDAAGLAVATRIQSDITVMEQAATNASHGINILETADGGLSNISDILQRMKSLATQSLSGAVTDTERAYIDAEFSELIAEIDSIAQSTQFNGDSLLDGTSDWVTGTGVDFLLGTDTTNDVLSVEIDDSDATALGVNALSVDTQANATAAAAAIDTAIDSISATRANVGATMSRFEFRADNIAQATENLEAANSSIVDADIAAEQAELSSAEVKTNAAISALAQANSMSSQLMSLFQ
ncbi:MULTISPECIES: flagellin [Curvivirga]|uniref:flagellin n=1 Tax=Curvivirga TaxID=2856846 RepID=UPI0012BBC279|nr:flagellin [Curvivirga aplysinae]MTI09723.1 flagellin [Curvivirga aplysinae]